MTANLPPQLLKLFVPRPALQFAHPLDKSFNDRKKLNISPIASFLSRCKNHDVEYKHSPTASELRQERLKNKNIKSLEIISQRKETWDPTIDPNAVGTDPYRTLFVSRLSYQTTESRLLQHFEYYGRINRIHIVHDTKNSNKPRGYAFIEFERESDMRAACKESDGIRLDGRRIVVDVERGRTVKEWLPRKLGGGLGGYMKVSVAQGRRINAPPISAGGHYSRRDSNTSDRYRSSGGRSYGNDHRDKPYERRSSGYQERRSSYRSTESPTTETAGYGEAMSGERKSYGKTGIGYGEDRREKSHHEQPRRVEALEQGEMPSYGRYSGYPPQHSATGYQGERMPHDRQERQPPPPHDRRSSGFSERREERRYDDRQKSRYDKR